MELNKNKLQKTQNLELKGEERCTLDLLNLFWFLWYVS